MRFWPRWIGRRGAGQLTLAQFNDLHFIPHVKEKKKPSTAKFYREVFDNHLRGRVGEVKLRDSPRGTRRKCWIRSGFHTELCESRQVFRAVQLRRAAGLINGANPAREAKAEGSRSDPQRHAYTLPEVQHMLEVSPEPARAVVGVAAFSGLRESEIRGLRWEDYTGESLHVRRSIWRTHVGELRRRRARPPCRLLRRCGRFWTSTGREVRAVGFSWGKRNVLR